jgi:hypothetical protein
VSESSIGVLGSVVEALWRPRALVGSGQRALAATVGGSEAPSADDPEGLKEGLPTTAEMSLFDCPHPPAVHSSDQLNSQSVGLWVVHVFLFF